MMLEKYLVLIYIPLIISFVLPTKCVSNMIGAYLHYYFSIKISSYLQQTLLFCKIIHSLVS